MTSETTARNTQRLAAEFDDRLSGWASLSATQRAELLARHPLKAFNSGGAQLTVNGVDRFFASEADAKDELAARAQFSS